MPEIPRQLGIPELPVQLPPRPKRKLLNNGEAADYLGIAGATLAVWRCRRRYHGGPSYVLVGRRVFYRIEDLDKWLESRRVTQE